MWLNLQYFRNREDTDGSRNLADSATCAVLPFSAHFMNTRTVYRPGPNAATGFLQNRSKKLRSLYTTEQCLLSSRSVGYDTVTVSAPLWRDTAMSRAVLFLVAVLSLIESVF